MSTRISDATRRTLMTRQSALTALSKHPSWPEFVAEVGRKQKRIERILVANALSSQHISEQRIDYLRGFIHGMRWLSSVPTTAEHSLERFLRTQGVPVLEEEEAE